MKTIEEKAEAYDEALEKAQNALKDDTITATTIAYLQDIFPELKESEDESIRTAILNHLKKMWGNSQDNVCGIHVEDAIAWLEKQGEQKTFDYENANIQQKDFAPKIEPKFKVEDWVTIKE